MKKREEGSSEKQHSNSNCYPKDVPGPDSDDEVFLGGEECCQVVKCEKREGEGGTRYNRTQASQKKYDS